MLVVPITFGMSHFGQFEMYINLSTVTGTVYIICHVFIMDFAQSEWHIRGLGIILSYLTSILLFFLHNIQHVTPLFLEK